MTTVTLAIGTGTQQWTPPADCLTIDLIEIWGPGGSGGKRAGRVTGAGAGAYVSIPGPIPVSALLTAGTVPYQTGRGGAAQATATTAGNPGTAKSWFYSATVFAADFGLGGLASGTSGATAGGVGGLVANCIPTWAGKAGGSGGTDSSASGASAGGASGSAAGVGVSGAPISSAAAGGTTTAPAGGGNGGAASISAVNATAGSSPGGGGGSINNASNSSGAGADGQISITYTPYKLPTQSWSPHHQNITLIPSSSDTVVTFAGVTGTYAPGFGGISKTSGKYYWEVVITLNADTGGRAAGIGNIASSVAAGAYLGSGLDTVGWYFGGNLQNNGGNVLAVATWVTGDTLCFALDLDNHKLWARNGAGGWNNDVLANQNPATNTGGYTLPAQVYASAVVPAVYLEAITAPADTATGRFAQSLWAQSAPAGFNSWDPPQLPFRQQAQMLPIMAQ